MNNDGLIVSSSPHIKTKEGTRYVMLDVIIALLAPFAMSIYFYGARSISIVCVSTASCIAFEWLYRKWTKKSATIGDLSAVVTGILLGLNMPATIPLWIPVIGAFFAIVIVKQLYGGLGKNFVNPALAARAFLFSWASEMTTFVEPGSKLSLFGNVSAVDIVTSATPLASLKTGSLPDVSIFDLSVGNVAGCIGETSTLVILVAGLYLILRRVISARIPLCYLLTVAVLTFLFPLGGVGRFDFMLYSLCSGGVVFGAFFMATDYATSPVTPWGRIVYGVGCGALTVMIRYFGAYAEGVTFAILIMNCCSWVIEKITRPNRYGLVKEKKEAVKNA